MKTSYLSKRAAVELGISRERLNQAIKNGEVKVRYTGINNRIKVSQSDVLKILTGAGRAENRAAA
jgi:RNA-binding protein YlmH